MTIAALILALGLCLYLALLDHRHRLLPGWATTMIGVLGVVEAQSSMERHVTILVVIAVLLLGVAIWTFRVRHRRFKRPPIHGGDVALLVAISAWLNPLGLCCAMAGSALAALAYRRIYHPGQTHIPLGPPLIIASVLTKTIFMGFQL